MPYSIERECSAVPLTPPKQKMNRAFILAKLAEYFYDKRKAPPQSVWPEFEKTTGLEPVSVATDRMDGDRGWLNFTVPDGVTPMKPLPRDQFELEVGESKVMVGIGRPYISPSVYTSLCQATPVVLPTYADPEEIHRGYNLFNGYAMTDSRLRLKHSLTLFLCQGICSTWPSFAHRSSVRLHVSTWR